MTDTPTLTASPLGGRYVLGDLLARGGMAEVYRAVDVVLDRPVAVKVLRTQALDPSGHARFVTEARMLAGLNHPGLVTVLDAGTSADEPYLVMELVDGTTLADCGDGEPLQSSRVAAFGAQLAAALAYVHSRGVVHRDIKPANILLTADDRVLLTDFGIAKLLGDSAARFTATGFTMGTAAYVAPEQVRGGEVGPAADVYSLGLVLLEALTGQPAYSGPPAEVALARLSVSPAIPAALSRPWQTLLAEMTKLEAQDRPSADDVAARLHELAGPVTPREATAALRTNLLDKTRAERSERPQGMSAPATRWVVIALVAASIAIVAALLISSVPGAGNGSAGTHNIPPNLPPRISQDLQQLHQAVNG